MINYKKVLFATDYSEDSDIALIHALDIAQRYDSELHVFHVMSSAHRYLQDETTETGLEDLDVAEITPEVIERVTNLVKERYAKRLAGVNKLVWKVVPGVPFVEIVRYARDENVDLVVLGATGNSEMEGVKYGSTVENVSRRAHCHVMAIRNPEKAFIQ